jgi:sugar phosphate isomerase/epimerase
MNIAIPIDRLLHLHASDSLADTKDLRLDRGMPGDGRSDNRRICTWMEETGFNGAVEVEIFSKENWRKRDCDDVVKTIIARKDENL